MTTLSPTPIYPGPGAAGRTAAPRASALRPSPLALLVWAIAALVLAGAVMSAALLASGRIDWMRGFLAASIVSVAATLFGLFPLLLAVRGSPVQIMLGWLLGSMVRAGCSLAGCFIAAYAFKTPPAPTFLLMVVYYTAVLVAETRVMVRSHKISAPAATVPQGNK